MHLPTDIRFGLRLLKRSPGFAAALIAVLVIGIGATTAMFSLLEGVVLRPLPYPHPEQLDTLWSRVPNGNGASVSAPDFLDWKEEATAFEAMAAIEYDSYSIADGQGPALFVPSANVSGDFFRVVGLPALRGRLLGPEDDRLGAPRVCVMSAGLWQRRFASDPAIIGRAIVMNGEPFTVIGVGPDNFRFAMPRGRGVDIWTPLALSKDWAERAKERGDHSLKVIGRRKLGVTSTQAQTQLSAIAMRLAERYPEKNVGRSIELQDLKRAMVGSLDASVWILFGAVGLVFLAVCINVANLLLARASARRFEMAARAALGAPSSRLAAQVVTETLVLFVIAGVGGTLVARVLVDIFKEAIIQGAASQLEMGIDRGALLFSVGTALVFGLLSGLVPAFEAARVDPHVVLKESSTRASLGRRALYLRGGLVIGQVALAFALLVGGGLALRAFARIASSPPGFDAESVATGWINRPEKKTSAGELRAFEQRLLERVSAEPGVIAAAYASSIPMGGSHTSSYFRIEGRPPFPRGNAPELELVATSPKYFDVLRIPLLRGRMLPEADVEGGRQVVVISEDMAKRFFPGEDPIGQRVDWSNNLREIVGVVGAVRSWGLGQAGLPVAYVPSSQAPIGFGALAVRTPDPEALLDAFPRLVADIDPEQSISRRDLMTDIVRDSVAEQRFVATLLAAFSGSALLLAALGIFGLVSYTTGQRTRELGIRLALGATPERLVSLVMGSGARLIAIGLGAGLVGALALGRVVASRVEGAAAFDPLVTLVIFVVLALTGLLACLLPALRASRIPPATALRYE